MTLKEADILVSILNNLVEKFGYDVEEYGFGYFDDGRIAMADGGDFETGLEWILSEIEKLEEKTICK